MQKTMDKTVETPQKTPVIFDKTLRAMQYMEEGLNPKDALNLATGNINPHRNTVYDLKKKYEKWSLLHDKRQKRFAKVSDKICKDYLDNGENAGVAARLAGDGLNQRAERDHPKVNLNLNVNAQSVSPVDLSLYRMAQPVVAPGAVEGPPVGEPPEGEG